MDSYHLNLYAHAGLGVAALATYWVAALSTKGSRPHKLAGKAYVLVMIGLLLPAVPLSWRALQHFSLVFGLFLFYLLLITATALRRAWTSVRRKRDFAAYADSNFRRLAWFNIGAGAAVLGIGAASSQPVLLGFSAVGVLSGRGMLKLAADGPAHPRWWMAEHIGAVLGCGVATHIAFLLIGLPRLLPEAWNGPQLQTFSWLAPLLVSFVAARLLGRKYLPAPQKSASVAQPSPVPRVTTASVSSTSPAGMVGIADNCS
jgi:uncharacterized membrane protein